MKKQPNVRIRTTKRFDKDTYIYKYKGQKKFPNIRFDGNVSSFVVHKKEKEKKNHTSSREIYI